MLRPLQKTSLTNSHRSKFLGKQQDPKYKQQSTLAFKNSNGSRKTKDAEAEDDENHDDVQPAKKRKIAITSKKEDDDGDLPMQDVPQAVDAATETNGNLTADKASDDLFISEGEESATGLKNTGKF